MNKIYLNRPGNSTIVMIFAPTGSMHEHNEMKGISHFLEHMSFKGTESRTAKQLSFEIENLGGVLNAYTDYELTCYWAKVSNKHKNVALNVIEDLVCNSLIDEKEIEKERNVIIQELKMREDDPQNSTYELFYKTLFAKKCGLHLPIIGTKKTLKNINRAELIDYRKLHYEPLTMIVVGDVENEEIIETDIKRKDEIILRKNKNRINIIKKQDLEQANIIIGNVKKMDNFSAHYSDFILKIMKGIYNGMSGRLFTKLREDNHLCYSIRFDSYVWANNYVQWSVSMGLDKENIKMAKEMIIDELNREILNEDLYNSYIKCCGKQQLFFDDITNIAETIAYIHNRSLDWKDYIIDYEKNLNKATPQVRDFIKEIDFNDNKLVGIIPNEK